MNVKLITLPCPKCSRPLAIEAPECICGYQLFRDPAPAVQKSFPPIQVMLPELQHKLRIGSHAASPRAKKPTDKRSEPPVSVLSMPSAEPVVHESIDRSLLQGFSLLTDQTTESRQGRRLLLSSGIFIAVLAVFGVWGGFFGQISNALASEGKVGYSSHAIKPCEQQGGLKSSRDDVYLE